MDQVKAPKCVELKARDRGRKRWTGLHCEMSLSLLLFGLQREGSQTYVTFNSQSPCPLGNMAPLAFWHLTNQINNSLPKRKNKEELLQDPQVTLLYPEEAPWVFLLTLANTVQLLPRGGQSTPGNLFPYKLRLHCVNSLA